MILTTYITVRDLDRLLAFLTQAFDAEITHSMQGHASLRIGDSDLMAGGGPGVVEHTGAFHLYVADCDTTFAQAIAAGAESLGEPADRPYGERSAFIKDFAGNHWFIATRATSKLAPPGAGTLVPYAFPANVRAFIDFLNRAFGAEQLHIHEHEGRVVHAAARIGASVIEMGEPHDGTFLPSRYFLDVDNCDAVYQQALAAGSTSKSVPADLPYGRSAIITDPFGYEWVPTSPSEPRP